MTNPFERLRANPRIRAAAQILLVLVLVGLVYGYTALDNTNEEQEATIGAVSGVVASACDAASFADLQRQGLLEECRLAQEGDLASAIPATPSASNDPIPDAPDTSPEDVQSITDTRLGLAISAYFDAHPLDVGDTDYQESIRSAVQMFLIANPPPQGRPPSRSEIRGAVRTALIANPPPAGPAGTDGTDGADGTNGTNGTNGADGKDGVSVVATSLDGCDVVFTYSDDTTTRVGPLCGPAGDQGPPGQQGERGPSGIVNVVDDCPPAPNGEFVTDVTPIYDADTATLRITCTSSGLIGGQNP